jgi:glyoxylase-like metal-dependent hydrolase (beta-lactamase superfamily II)
VTARVHHLSCGTMCPRGRYFVMGDGSPFARARIVCHVFLVETAAAGMILVDTGLGARDVADAEARLGRGFVKRAAPVLDPAEPVIAQLRVRGIDPREVRHVVPTHLDVDHAGGLPDLPDARVHVLQTELDAFTSPPADRYRPAHVAHGPRWETYGAGGEDWFGFASVRPIIPGCDDVLIIPLPGHTAGHAGVAVRGDRGWMLHAGDAYYSHHEMHPTRPRTPLGLRLQERRSAFDDVARAANAERIRVLARDRAGEVTVVSAHCAVEYDRATSAAAARATAPERARRTSP